MHTQKVGGPFLPCKRPVEAKMPESKRLQGDRRSLLPDEAVFSREQRLPNPPLLAFPAAPGTRLQALHKPLHKEGEVSS